MLKAKAGGVLRAVQTKAEEYAKPAPPVLWHYAGIATLGLFVEPEGKGTASANKGEHGFNVKHQGYYIDDKVTLTAKKKTLKRLWKFSHWGGDGLPNDSPDNPLVVTMDSHRKIWANFK